MGDQKAMNKKFLKEKINVRRLTLDTKDYYKVEEIKTVRCGTRMEKYDQWNRQRA